jgi:hypothetical protein
MKENGKTVRLMVLVSTHTQMDLHMKVSGSLIIGMEMEN